MKTYWIAIFVLIISFCAPLRAQEDAKSSMCPVMRGERIKKKFHVTWEGREIYFCCKSCVKRFKKHPEKYLRPTN